jgi:glutamine amidotransferase
LKKPQICILDYGSGNVASVFNAFNKLEIDVKISNSEDELENSTHIVLPGVGSFNSAMSKISKTLPLELMTRLIANGKPFLGICVGMQVLAVIGYEGVKSPGLGYIDSKVVKLPSEELPVPHIGWNNVRLKKESPLFQGISSGTDFYFVHSYFMDLPTDSESVVGTADYGISFPAAIAKGNLMGVQFHPEKSQSAGLALLANFARVR